MKRTRTAAFAALGVVAALSLTACGSDDGGKDSSGKSGSSSSSESSDSSKGGSDGGASDGGSGSGGTEAGDAQSDSGGGTSSRAGSANGSGKSATKDKVCKTEDLAIDATAPDKTTGRIDITMINRGSTTCSATGFPGVDIKDVDNTSNPIGRGHAQPRVTTLKPGDAAVFNLAYDIDDSGDSLSHPTNIQVTPPNETHTVSLKWPAGAGEIKGAYTDVEVYPTHTTK